MSTAEEPPQRLDPDGPADVDNADLLALAERIRENVNIKSRYYFLSRFHSCFVGKDAVTWMVESGEAADREAAVRLGQRLQRAGFFHHVVDDHDFHDRYLFYRFYMDETVRDRKRMGVPRRAPPSTPSMVEGDDCLPATTRDPGSQDTTTAPETQALLRSLLSRGIGSPSGRGSTVAPATGEEMTASTESALVEALAQRIRAAVDVRDRSYRFRTYTNVFTGDAAVDWMLSCGLVRNRLDAVALGRRVLAAGFFHHVADDHDFEDMPFFYRFYIDEDELLDTAWTHSTPSKQRAGRPALPWGSPADSLARRTSGRRGRSHRGSPNVLPRRHNTARPMASAASYLPPRETEGQQVASQRTLATLWRVIPHTACNSAVLGIPLTDALHASSRGHPEMACRVFSFLRQRVWELALHTTESGGAAVRWQKLEDERISRLMRLEKQRSVPRAGSNHSSPAPWASSAGASPAASTTGGSRASVGSGSVGRGTGVETDIDPSAGPDQDLRRGTQYDWLLSASRSSESVRVWRLEGEDINPVHRTEAILPAPPAVVLRLLTDASLRRLWDPSYLNAHVIQPLRMPVAPVEDWTTSCRQCPPLQRMMHRGPSIGSPTGSSPSSQNHPPPPPVGSEGGAPAPAPVNEDDEKLLYESYQGVIQSMQQRGSRFRKWLRSLTSSGEEPPPDNRWQSSSSSSSRHSGTRRRDGVRSSAAEPGDGSKGSPDASPAHPRQSSMDVRVAAAWAARLAPSGPDALLAALPDPEGPDATPRIVYRRTQPLSLLASQRDMVCLQDASVARYAPERIGAPLRAEKVANDTAKSALSPTMEGGALRSEGDDEHSEARGSTEQDGAADEAAEPRPVDRKPEDGAMVCEISVQHQHVPPMRGLVRAENMLDAFVLLPTFFSSGEGTHVRGTRLIYLSQYQANGNLPPWMNSSVLDAQTIRPVQYLTRAVHRWSETGFPATDVPSTETEDQDRDLPGRLMSMSLAEEDAEGDMPEARRVSQYPSGKAAQQEHQRLSMNQKGWMTRVRNEEEGFHERDSEDEDAEPPMIEGIAVAENRTRDPSADGHEAPSRAQDGQHSSESSSVAPVPPSLSLDDFETLAVLGRGGYGKVLQVRHRQTGQVFAMKVMRKKELVRRKQIRRTLTERDILSAVRHPFIVELKFAFQTPSKLYMGMDFIRGGDFFTLLSRDGLVDEERAKLYVAELVLALEYLHSREIVYRDLKPENILVDDEGHLRLTDFGLSRSAFRRMRPLLPVGAHFVDERSSRTKQAYEEAGGDFPEDSTRPFSIGPGAGEVSHSFCGTEQYMAPEVLLQHGHTSAVDWWTLGIIVSEMLTGRHPFRGPNHYGTLKNIVHPAVPPATLTLVSSKAASFMQGLLQKNQRRRLGSPEAGGARQIKEHPWLAGVDFERVMRREIRPRYVPRVGDVTDISRFEDTFTREAPVDSVASVGGASWFGDEEVAQVAREQIQEQYTEADDAASMQELLWQFPGFDYVADTLQHE